MRWRVTPYAETGTWPKGTDSDNWLDFQPLTDQEMVRYPPIANASRMADSTASALLIK
jgi:hypothetical protein